MRSETRSKKELESELQTIKRQMSKISEENASVMGVLNEKAKSDEIGSGLFSLFKLVMDDRKRIEVELKRIADKLDQIETEHDADFYEQEDQDLYQQENKPAKVQPISGLDAQILQIIQRSSHEMACADDIKKHMSYKGRNAASARLNRLYEKGYLQRFQLGHKVYYKFDAGKTTNTLIVSPPQ
jgi:hypothetical protein